MQGEYLSIETAQKIIRLGKEKQELSDIVAKYDVEVNKQHQIIKNAYEYLCFHFPQETIQVLTLKELLKQGLNCYEENKDAKTI